MKESTSISKIKFVVLCFLTVFILFTMTLSRASAVTNASSRIDIYDQYGLESGHTDSGQPYDYKYGHEPYLTKDGRTDIGGWVGSFNWNGKPDCLAQSGCNLFSHAHAIEWVLGSHLGDQVLKDLVVWCCNPSNWNGNHNFSGCAMHKSRGAYNSFDAYHDYARTQRGIATAKQGSRALNENALREGFCAGEVYIVQIPGHYVCAVDYVICDANGNIIADQDYVNCDAAGTITESFITTAVPAGGAVFVQIVDSAPSASTHDKNSSGVFHNKTYELDNSANRLNYRAGKYPLLYGASYFVKVSDFCSGVSGIVAILQNRPTWSGHNGSGETSGTCGENLTWELDGSTLVISGSGQMDDFDAYKAPWNYLRSNITSVQLPDGLTKIGAYAFLETQLTAVVIPDSVTEISGGAFEGCTNLQAVVFSDHLKTLGGYVFSKAALTRVELPDALESIGDRAFFNNPLTEATMPMSITTISGNPFDGCSNNLVINGYAGSAAQSFASEKGYRFVELTPIAVTDMTVIGSQELTITDIETCQLSVNVLPANATNKKVLWSTDNLYTAEVDENGLVTAKKPGTITVIAGSLDNPAVSVSFVIHVVSHAHVYEWKVMQEPTFEADGTRQCACIYCNKVRDEETIPRLTIALQDGSTWPGDANNNTGYPAGNLVQGKNFGLRGVVVAYENLESVTAHIYSDSGEDALTPKTVEPGATSLDIRNSSINQELAFESLSAGMYRYVVTARTVSGNEATLIDSMFSVGNALVPSQNAFPDEFYAYIRNVGTGAYMTNQLDNNIAGETFTGNVSQIWHFVQQNSGAYAIYSEVNEACMDVENYSTTNGTNVFAYTKGYNGTTNQMFYIHSISGGYQLSPANSNSGCMLDMDAETLNVQIWSSGTQLAQVFDIIKLRSTTSYEANGGWYAPVTIIKDYAESITVSADLPTRLGFACVGWSETSDADHADYLPGDTLSKKGDVTLYAVWSPVTLFVLPSGLTVIEEDAFAGAAMTCVVCPEGLTEIGSGAFANCPNLCQIYIPESVKVISETAFEGCPNEIDVFSVSDLTAQKFVDAHVGFRLIEID